MTPPPEITIILLGRQCAGLVNLNVKSGSGWAAGRLSPRGNEAPAPSARKMWVCLLGYRVKSGLGLGETAVRCVDAHRQPDRHR